MRASSFEDLIPGRFIQGVGRRSQHFVPNDSLMRAVQSIFSLLATSTSVFSWTSRMCTETLGHLGIARGSVHELHFVPVASGKMWVVKRRGREEHWHD
jgi:hypothetical protein